MNVNFLARMALKSICSLSVLLNVTGCAIPRVIEKVDQNSVTRSLWASTETRPEQYPNTPEVRERLTREGANYVTNQSENVIVVNQSTCTLAKNRCLRVVGAPLAVTLDVARGAVGIAIVSIVSVVVAGFGGSWDALETPPQQSPTAERYYRPYQDMSLGGTPQNRF